MRTGSTAVWILLAVGIWPNSYASAQWCKQGEDGSSKRCCAAGEMWDERFARCVPDARSLCVAGDADACVIAGDHYRASYRASNRRADATQAVAYYRQACDAGAAAGCNALGEIELRDPDADTRGSADAWFARACQGGHMRGCTSLAEWLLARNTARERAVELLRRACDKRDQRACARLALVPDVLDATQSCALAQGAKAANDVLGQLAWAKIEAEGRCGQSDRNQVYRAFEAACEGGEVEGCFEIAQRQLSGWAPEPQLSKVRAWLDRACDQRFAAACSLLADDFEGGKSGPQDPSLMAEALERGCRFGSAPACVRVAKFLDETAPDEVTPLGAAWSAACQADATQCHRYAQHLLDHPERERDTSDAAQLLEKDCERQHAPGCALLADLQGWRAVLEPPAAATRAWAEVELLHERACGYGDAGSCVKAALMLLNGKPTGHERARTLLNTACDQGSQLACAYLKAGPYPFPYPSRAAVPLRFAPPEYRSRALKAQWANRSAGPAGASLPLPKPAAPSEVAADRASLDDVAPPDGGAADGPAVPDDVDRSHRAWLQSQFVVAASGPAVVGSAIWAARAGLGAGFDLAVRVPMFLGVARLANGAQSVGGFGNPHLSLAREGENWNFSLGFTLPLAYVGLRSPSGVAPGSEVGLQAAADSGGLADAYLWSANSAGITSRLRYQTFEGTWYFAADLGAALTAPFYGRDNAELFASLRGQVGLRVAREWVSLLGLAIRGLSDIEQARLAFEPQVHYAAEGGGRFMLGLCIVVWSEGDTGLGGSPWAGLDIRVAP